MNLKVTINYLEHAKIMHWVHKAGGLEVSGFGRVLRVGTHLHVSKVYLLQQKNTAGSTVLDAADLSRALYQTKDDPGDFNFWWHSHHSMAAFFSGTDHATIQDLGSNGWLLATCFNNRGETKTGIYTTMPVEMLHEDGVKLEIAAPAMPDAMKAQLDALYDLKVNENRFYQPPDRKWGSKAERKARRRIERMREENLSKSGLLLPPASDDKDEDDDEYTEAEMAEILSGYDRDQPNMLGYD